jgi:eukaryotic-like serine/threonine-protein kinase
MTSILCPSVDDLMRWLNQRFDPVRRAEIGTHVDTCVECQATLEALTQARVYGLLGLGQDPPGGLHFGAIAKSDRATAHDETTDLAPVEPNQGSLGERTESLDGASYRALNMARTEPLESVAEPTLDHTPADRTQTVDSSFLDTEPDVGAHSPTAPPVIPSYELLEEIGSGGMGVVFKARQRGLNRLVALKMIRGSGRVRPDQLARIRIEAEAVARLRHPNIVHIYEIGEVEGLPFLSLELLEGGTLEDRLAGDPQPGGSAAELMATLARAIQMAHDAKIIHRDLKPSNVLFDGDGIPKITDFGLAKRLESDSGQTESGQIMGTPCYMAPEQAMGHTRDVGPAADVYSLGAILYEMLTGRPPFKGETPMETVRQVINDDVVPPTRLVPKVARDLETICLHCLNKEQPRRYRSALALAEDLDCFLAGKPIKARPTALWERGYKLARRRPVAATLCTLGLLATILLTGVWLQYRSSQQERDRQDMQDRADLERTNLEKELQAQNHVNQQRWSDAEPILTGIEEAIRDKAGFDDQRKRVDEMLAQCRRGRAIDAATSEDQRRLIAFRLHRKDALFHEAHFTGLDLAGDLEAVRRSTRAALAVFARPGSPDSWALQPLPASLEPRQQEEIKEGCYELLLILAEAIEQPDEGLRLLDQAAELRPPTRVYHLRRADHLARRGDATAAEQERARAKAQRASSALDHFLSGKEHYKRGEWRAARSQFDEAILIQPDHFWAHCLSAICSLQLTEPIRAHVEFSACLQAEKGFAWLYELRGFTSYKIAALARLAVENLGATGSRLSSEIETQLKAAEIDFARALDLLKQRPNDELQFALLVNRALLWYERREWDKAIADLKSAIKLNGRGWEAVEVMAQVYDRQGQPDLAIEFFSQAITLQPKMAPLYRARAGVDLRRKQHTPSQRERALRDLDMAIGLEPPHSPFLPFDQTNRGQMLHGQGREDEALAACEAALEVDRKFLEAHYLRIDVLRKLKRHRDVISSCNALLKLARPSAELYELRALAKEDLSDYEGAIEDDTLAVALRPNDAVVLARRGALFLITDAPRSALRDFDESIRLDPSSPDSVDAYLGRGLTKATLGMHREAVADAARAVRQGTPAHRRLYNAARIYARAAIAATAEVRKTGQDAADLVSRYQDQALELLRQAVARLPAAQRAAYVRDVVLKDPALATLRNRLRSLDLAGSTISSDRFGDQSRN